MALNVWNQSSGYSFGLFQERTKLTLNLPVTASTGVNFSLISGNLPPGLRVADDKIIGTPFEVPRTTTYKFCIRASSNNEISDRTFTIDIAGPDEPSILTPAGDLPVGPNSSYFALDSSYIEFQISAVDFDTAAGQQLTYFIANDDGALPPGLSLSKTGLVSGFVEPALVIKISDGTGAYDAGYFDNVVYDFGSRPTNGFNSFLYDQLFYDYSTPSNPPRKVNRNYEFVVSITDGDTVARRKFRIFVVADDFFRADNTFLPAGTGVYKADGTFLRAPVWRTPEYLGLVRANNYVTKILDIYEPGDQSVVIYELISGSLPPGMEFDIATGEIFGTVPYQSAVTKRYTFTARAVRYSNQIAEAAATNKTFYIDVQGEIDSVITWNTPANLGTIPANFISNLRVSATTTVENAVLVYTLEGGRLPPGLSLASDGEITGKVNQYGTLEKPGLTRFFDSDVGATATAVTLASSSATPLFGANTVFTATVTPSTVPGRIIFLQGNTVLGYANIVNGIAEFVNSSLSLGAHSIVARYPGNPEYSSSNSAPLLITVGLASTRVTLTTNTTATSYGGNITLTATITSPTGFPTGSIRFKDGVTVIGTSNIINGQAVLDIRSLIAGNHVITAEYLGAGTFGGDISESVTITVSPNTGTTPTSMILAFSNLAPNYGDQITITATVTPNLATGTVIFRDGTTVLGTSVIANGTAVFNYNRLSGGAHTINAIYTGDQTYASYTTSSTLVSVQALTTLVSFLTSSTTPSYGNPFVLTASATSIYGTPTGTMTFKEGAVILGTVAMTGGTAIFNTSNRVTVGTHTYTAYYSGDDNYSSSISYDITVQILATSVPFSAPTISSSANTVELGSGRPAQSCTWTIQNGVIRAQATGLPYHSYGNVTAVNIPAAQNYDLSWTYRGGTNIASQSPAPVGLGLIGLWLNGVAMFNPSAGGGAPEGFTPVPGFHYNAASEEGSILNYSFGEDAAGGHAAPPDMYHYHDGNFFPAWETGNGASNSVPGTSTGIADCLVIPYLNDGLRHVSTHSKILGFAADGYPVYGPYGYSISTNSQSSVRRMVSGYRLKNSSYRAGTGASNLTTYPMGIFVEDFEYSTTETPQAETVDLDIHNGRYCVTPDYPNGTYAYFVTVNANGDPVYPYVLGNTFYGVPTNFNPPA